MKRALLMAGLGLVLSVAGGEAQAQLEINFDFTDFNTGPSGDVNTILNGASLADARAVMEHAAAIWEDAFETSQSSLDWAASGVITQNISVTWANHGGSTLATAGIGSFSGATDFPWGSNSATLNWDGDAGSTFFVDTTPGDNSEWQQFSSRDLDLGGSNNINVERVSYDAPAGDTRSNTDFLSVAIHEIGHAIGFSGGYPLFDNAESGGSIAITSGIYSGASLDIDGSGAHTNLTIDSPGNDSLGSGQSDYPYDPGGGFFSNSTYNPMIMGPSITDGVRKGLTAADIAIVAEYLEFDMSGVNFNPVPEPSALAMLLIGGLMVARRRRRA